MTCPQGQYLTDSGVHRLRSLEKTHLDQLPLHLFDDGVTVGGKRLEVRPADLHGQRRLAGRRVVR